MSLEDEEEGLAGEGHRCMWSTRKNVVPGEERRLWRKAKGDGVVDGGQPVKREKG